MQTNKRLILCVALACLAGIAPIAHSSEQAQVWVFTLRALPPLQQIERADRVFVLDAAEPSLKALSFANPQDAERAKRRAMTIIQSPQGQVMIAHLRDSAEAIAVAWQYGIHQLPAVLVDERYVVYGVYDVESALKQIVEFRYAD